MSKVDKNTEFSLGAFNTKNHDNKINFTSLPTDVFFLICSYISPQDSILCRRVSRTWFQVFANAETSWNFMKLYFPRCREMRRAAERRKPDSDGGPNWTRIFSNVAERYYRLRQTLLSQVVL
ncbi:hypothetical protein F4805DRAFT_79093 [Annulohypoxylon moriforme]|nr:hypothetical protein F4805DRAFT_79093 [Annulohypoxylon moriforme]